MRIWVALPVVLRPAAVAVGMALGVAFAVGGLACGSSSDGGGSAVEQACGAVFEQLTPCAAGLPASEVARIRPLYVQSCAAEVGLPGSGVTASALSACAKALATPLGCFGQPAACEYIGTLANGAACNEGFQCTSGVCTVALITNADGSETPASCGTCQTPDACGATLTGCTPGTTCSATTSSCQPIVYGAAGDTCDQQVLRCGSGLTCLPESGVCAAPAADGAPCTSFADCQGGVCTLARVCATPTYGKPGDPCDAENICLVGFCPFGDTVTCPTVIANGQPCVASDETKTCDTLSTCTDGVCVPGDSVVCK